MTKFTDVMVDLETLGTAPGSVILSIGAVAFGIDAQEGAAWSTFNSGPISVRSSRGFGLAIDESTLGWWLKQEAAAVCLLRAAFESDATPLTAALMNFNNWYPTGARLWGNGANFDNVLLRAVWQAAQPAGCTKPPWSYRDDRCYRTMKRVFPNVKEPPFDGVRHDALADAVHQTRHLVALLNAVNGWEKS